MIVALAPAAASANTTAKINTFNFTGALVGTLKITPQDCEGNVASSNGAEFDNLMGKLRGSEANDWTIMIVTPKNGTYKLHHGHLAGVQVNPDPMGPHPTAWGDATGTLTVKGSTGSINAELSSATTKIDIIGSWNCPAVK
jgi:hypothetical protein